MTRPTLKLELEPIDKVIEVIGWIGLTLLIALPFFYMNQLPETIPTHYGLDGKPDKFGGQNSIWALSIIGSLTFLGIFWLNKYPHIFNYAVKITNENAAKQYKLATRMLRSLNALISCALAYMVYYTIQSALGQDNQLGIYFAPILLISIFSLVGYFTYQSFKQS